MDVDEVLTYKVRTDFDDIENKDVKRRKVEDGDSEDEDEDYKNADEKEKERILAMLEDDIGEVRMACVGKRPVIIQVTSASGLYPHAIGRTGDCIIEYLKCRRHLAGRGV
jgi:hypothetical protein